MRLSATVRPRLWRAATAITLMIALVGGSELAGNPNRRDALQWATLMFFVFLPAYGIVLYFMLLGIESLLRRWTSVAGGIGVRALCVAVLIMVIGITYGLISGRPINFFRHYVLDPEPLSLTNLRADRWQSFSDGSAYLFSFDVSSQDFEAIRSRHGLEEKTIDWTGRRDWPSDSLLPEDGRLRLWEAYRRSESPLVFSGDRLTVITNSTRTHVYMFFDRYLPPTLH